MIYLSSVYPEFVPRHLKGEKRKKKARLKDFFGPIIHGLSL